MQAAKTGNTSLTQSVKDLKGLLSERRERSKRLQQQLSEAQSIQKLSSAQVRTHILHPPSKLPLFTVVGAVFCEEGSAYVCGL